MESVDVPLEDVSRKRLTELGRLTTSEHTVEEGLVAVDYAYVPFFETQPPLNETRHVSIYLPGLPHRPDQNTAGDPQEIALVGNLLRARSTELIVIKPEGLNKKAYVNKEGKITGDKVLKASLDQFMEICKNNGIDISSSSVDFTFYGYSEGSSQGASIAKALVEKGAHICGLIGIEPSGITGYDSPDTAELYPRNAWKIAKSYMRRNVKRPVTQTSLGHHLSTDLVHSYDMILQGNKPARKDSINNMLSILRRFSLGLAGIRTSRGVVQERLRLAWSINPDYEELLKAGIPVSIYSGTKSEVFPIDEMRSSLSKLARAYPFLVKHITSDTSHIAPNIASKGIGFTMALEESNEKK